MKKKRDEIAIKPYLRVIGDVHGKLGRYVELAKEAEYSIQVGDLYTGDAGHAYKYLSDNLSPEKHRVVAGNHDNYTEDAEGKFILQPPHFLGDYGVCTIPNFGDIFFMRGGDSIDKGVRKVGINWWAKEQLDYESMLKVMELYKQIKPDFVITHECPKSALPYFATMEQWRLEVFAAMSGSPVVSRTAEVLDQMFQIHQPRRHIFGHHHRSKIVQIGRTIFQCLAELDFVDFAKNSQEPTTIIEEE